ncbi:cytochrome b subunit of succinate dehydrogenase, Sdh3p [Coemansia sp. RSA 1822]|nr:cytochrome b subunit of succinate dehydrogenase, Sdh3p [Coemansia sp. RSA 638]KAJ2124392.1 cytochrome b subunit of succinate dehydrogenase, Sdh3p [Coemansia sp. RSA 720]KAJ2481574.1 cytochrome b subunit of succinate dehydrogenase, Sdh3p [Coemansia sp. RSA 2131]KAJ2543684.1 cytochrome b subunit of succinate dehydrogenase, Sdh3p [Coemansia sp. RSA 1853]KAJ2565148.1 cytochrome b subunit of succinate dehydrogenase, Sdh3p [Coemansia sp. RSA 1822]
MFSAAISRTRVPIARNARAFVATAQRKTSEESQAAVAERARKNRPVSPHLGIYKPQMSWVLSGLHRNTGVLVGGAAYLYTAAFGLAPIFGLDLGSVTAAATVASIPLPLLLGTKALIASSLSFHCFSGIRHLWWDSGRSVTNQGVFNSGYAVLTATALATGYLTFF